MGGGAVRDDLEFAKGLMIAAPIGALVWIAVIVAVWALW
jgi:hypothetical protein